MKFGSICSGIEAASLAFKSSGMTPAWFSEISDFPSSVLSHHYPDIINHGDMNDLPELILSQKVEAPELLCGGTPCQAFSLAGWKKGLVDSRGQLTLKFIEIADAIDDVRIRLKKDKALILWENVEGVLRDKTNAFGTFIAGLSGLEEEIKVAKWSNSGVLLGPKRNIAWRTLDAKFFGLPQQRRRLFVIATDTKLNPEQILFEKLSSENNQWKPLKTLYKHKLFEKDKTQPSLFNEDSIDIKAFENIQYINNIKVEVFRNYTDCLYSAYGTKWNGNAAAYNGSLYFSQNDKVRRLTPIECERLMGFPDDYTLTPGAKDTTRYQAVGNSWAIPVVKWLGYRIRDNKKPTNCLWLNKLIPIHENNDYKLYLFKNDLLEISNEYCINTSVSKNEVEMGNIFNIVHTDVKEKFYISEKASLGILRRKNLRQLKMNGSLENLFVLNSKEA